MSGTRNAQPVVMVLQPDSVSIIGLIRKSTERESADRQAISHFFSVREFQEISACNYVFEIIVINE